MCEEEGEGAVIERKEAKGDKVNGDYLAESRHLTALSDSPGETNAAYSFVLQKGHLSLFPLLEPGRNLVLWWLAKSSHERECVCVGGIELTKSVLKGLVETCRNVCRVGGSGEGARDAHPHPTPLVRTAC